MCMLIQYLGFMGPFFNFYFLVSWMFEHDCVDTSVLGVLYARVLYLHLLSAIDHVSHGKAL